MPVRKTRNLLPTVFQTDINDKFLSATMDQLISEPVLTNVNGYIGRKFAPTYKDGDSYITEPSNDRTNYQLEPSTVVLDDQNNVEFFGSYADYINKLRYYGANVDNHSRLFDNEYYTFDPLISFDKFVNFSQYHWLPNGPDEVGVNTQGIPLENTFNVSRNTATGRYVFSTNGVVDNSITLPRGGVYRFIIDQPGFPFWIQAELGTDGFLNATPTVSSRDVLGVENNGTDSGVITFNIPQTTAQDRFVLMPTVDTVDHAFGLAYSDIENQTLSQFRVNFPQYDSIASSLNGKKFIFIDQDQLNNRGAEIWNKPNVTIATISAISGNISTNTLTLASTEYLTANLLVSGTGIVANTIITGVDTANLTVTLSTALTADASGVYRFTSTGFEAGQTVSLSQRYNVWTIVFLDIGINTPLIRLVPSTLIAINQQVFVRAGTGTANKQYYKDFDSFLYQMPLLTAGLDNLYIQDGVDGRFNAQVKVVNYTDWMINVNTDIIGQQVYTSPNGVEFTNGLKIQFSEDVTPDSYRNNTYYVQQVGNPDTGIRLVPVDALVTPELYNDENDLNFPEDPFPEYVTIDRSSLDRNAWSRNNRWFHRQVIADTAAYRGETPTYNQNSRALRPIVEFDADLLLFNSGRIGLRPVDVLDLTTTDAFSQLQGHPLTQAFGITLVNGLRVIFAADTDPTVRDNIYVLTLVQYTVDSEGDPSGLYYIKLTVADDGNIETYDTVTVTQGQYKGTQWWYTGLEWAPSQQKTLVQQEPLFDIHDSSLNLTTSQVNAGKSLGRLDRSTFAGTKLFGYLKNSAGVNDSILGFPLTYRNFSTQGDIEFQNYFTIDTFEYANEFGIVVTDNISTGFLQKIQDRYTLVSRNTWQTAAEFTKQYQQIGYVYDGTSNIFPFDVVPNAATGIPYVKVFRNFINLNKNQWVLVSNQIRLTTSEIFIGDGFTNEFRLTTVPDTVNGVLVIVNDIPRRAEGYYSVTGLVITFANAPTVGDIVDIRVIVNPAIGDKIDILVYSNQVSNLGFYQVPLNLDLNAQNIDVNTVTLGQMRNHLVALGQNSTTVDGDVIGTSNLRDVDIKRQGGSILQHSAPVPYGKLFLLDPQANFVDSLRYAQREYTKFKNKFLELSTTLPGIQPTDPVTSVDLILAEINKVKNNTFPWFYSDMIPYGTLKNTLTYLVFDPFKLDYELTNVFVDQILTNRAILVYLNGVQLIKGLDYEFLYDRPAVRFIMDLVVDDTITIIEYANTDGSYVPETPTKLGLWAKFVPTIFEDNTYRIPIDVIRGHDGSITPSFGDYRDSFVLELEKRIYNNIKLSDTEVYSDIFATAPGKFRDSDYTIDEFTRLVSRNFQSWVGNSKLDFSTNDIFQSNDAFTWNYGAFNDRVNLEPLRGSWRACYQYFYDTFYPHLFPWEMLGFANEPTWWEDYYGAAPYTSGNKLLWDDLEAGRIRFGDREGTDSKFARPGLATLIPVDENGNLLPPVNILTATFAVNRAAGAWAVGQYGPVEYAWRTSSDYPFAIQQAQALAKPGRYFGIGININGYSPLNAVIKYLPNGESITQYLTIATNRHVVQNEVRYNGQPLTNSNTHRGAGYLNWIADYLISQGVNPGNKITSLLNNYQVNLAYRVSGFTDQTYLNVLAEQTSPSSINDTIVIPNENYKVHLNKSTPVQKLTYSAVIIEKNTNGYSVRGYDINNPFFTIIPSVVGSNSSRITVLNSSATIFNDYQNLKLTVPYGYEFTSQQQIVDFLISYERYLKAQGFVFIDNDGELGEIRNWRLSSKEFLYWAQQGWLPGSILVLSPVANSLNAISIDAITDGISDSQYGSRVVDQNFKLIRNVEYNVVRSSTNLKITLNDTAAVIGFVEVDLVQFEHVLIFDNTTVFDDIIYKPELGNRQFRLRLQGQKSANWDGSLYAPGFIYNSGTVDSWGSGKDYLKGDLIEYKNRYYTALQNIIASVEFQFNLWQEIPISQIKAGILPNFSTIAVESKDFYNSYPGINRKKQIEYSHGLIGFRPRQYLSDLGLSTTSQIEFYKGFIKQKGTMNSINQLTKAEFNNLTSNISIYEEWAVRLGAYGALDANPYVEIALDEKAYGVNPALAEFVHAADSSRGNGLTVFNQSQLYKATDQYTGKIALNRTEHSNYDNDVLTAGYVNLEDINAVIFDLADFVELGAELADIGTGYTIWCARDFSQDWNVYRVTETNNAVNTITNSLDGFISLTFDLPHELLSGDLFLIKNFDSEFDGFYQVRSVEDNNNILVAYPGDTANLTTITGLGLFYKLNSSRFQYMEDARKYLPLHGWKVGEKIWIDEDAATNLLQGQPVATANNTWKVYEKTRPWVVSQDLNRISAVDNDNGFGTSIKMTQDNRVIVCGAPYQGNTGIVNTFLQNNQNNFNEGFVVAPDAGNATVTTGSFGSVVDLAQLRETTYLAVGAPLSSIESDTNRGLVYVYKKDPNVSAFNKAQVLVGAAGQDQFGTSLAFNQDGSWLYVGGVGNDGKVSLYGLKRFVKENIGIALAILNSSTITVPFVRDPNLDPTDANSLLVTSFNRTYIPVIDYTVDGQTITFKNTFAQDTEIAVSQGPYYALLQTLTHPLGNTSTQYGYALSSSFDGAQLAVGAPNDTVKDKLGAGSVWVYDRVVEAFKADGRTDYITQSNIAEVYRVTVENIEVNDYEIIGSNTVQFSTPLSDGKVIFVETNEFNLLERITGEDEFIQANAALGTSLTICSNNCAIYVGAPLYDRDTIYNTGAVYKFHNRGRLYGTNEGTVINPVFTPGHSIRLDNFEVVATGRLMPSTEGNILTVSSAISANVGDYITQTVSGANVIVLANTEVTGSKTIIVGNYIDANVFTFGSGNISVNGSTKSAYPAASLDSFVADINDAGILGISALNDNGKLKLNSDKTVAANLVRMLAGTGTIYQDAGLEIFAQMQIITNPFNTPGEYFGTKVKLAANAYMLVISSSRGTTKTFTTVDNETTNFDDRSTIFSDDVVGSGSVYIYELYDDPRDDVENPGRYQYAQQLNVANSLHPSDPDYNIQEGLNSGDQFGYAIDIEGTYIIASAPKDDTAGTDSGSIYVFNNPAMTRGWKLVHYQEPKVDINTVSRAYLYDRKTNIILDNLQFIDPAKGRILGQAEQEISYKTDYDPAIYNRGTDPTANINQNIYWNNAQVGQVWWNLSKVRYIDYEQGTINYRTRHWGELFPGSEIEVLEWVESSVLPSQYVDSGADGEPKYADNSAYVEISFVDSVTNIIVSNYYFWVKNKTSIDPNDPTRNLPTVGIADIIANPKAQGIAYAAVIKDNTILMYNIADYLSAADTILHLDYRLSLDTGLIHSEYDLIQKGNPDAAIPDKIVDKLVDSLSGINNSGAVVPDPRLSVADSYGIDIRPRQTMFVDRLTAVNELVTYANKILIDKPIARQYNLTNLGLADPEPNFKLGEYNQRIETEIELEYIDTAGLPVGYKILVAQDTTQDNLWIVYELAQDKSWQISRVQSYKTDLYWDYVDWFDFKPDGTKYSLEDKLDYVVPTIVDAKKLPVAVGEQILVRLSIGEQGGFNIIIVNDRLEFQVVGIERGTIRLNTSLGNYADNGLGFGNQDFGVGRYDQNPNIEIRNIIYALKNDIFVNELQGEFNNIFFVLVNYLFTEQKYVDWIFKTSFTSVTHNLRTLTQFPSYIRDNQTYYQSYIEEVKPYRTKLREYLLNYNGDDTYFTTVTDFDLPSYYDTTSKMFRSPSGEILEADLALWQTEPYNQWYNNRKLVVDSIVIKNAGLGYTTPPTVTIINEAGGGSGAVAQAFIDGDTGSITQIIVTNSGAGYVSTPVVTIAGDATIPATAYAVIKNLQVRSFDTALKFDRVSYTSSIQDWQPNTQYFATQWYPPEFVGNGTIIGGNVVTHTDVDGIRSAYYLTANIANSGNNFVSNDYVKYSSANVQTANDRVIGYYQPGPGMPARDLTQLMTGIDYPGVQVQGLGFDQQPGFSGATTANIILSEVSNVSIGVGNTIVQGIGSLTVTQVYTSTIFGGVVNSTGFDSDLGNIGVLDSRNGTIFSTTSPLLDIDYRIRTGPLFGVGGFDNVEYDEDGTPLLGDSEVDTIIRSSYTDSALGTRAEDIDVDGGAYVDRYSSHAPEEMVPGIVFDTLDMRIYTEVQETELTDAILGYRMFSDVMRKEHYLRISDDFSTTLASPLTITDTEIFLTSPGNLFIPDVEYSANPGVVFIGAERIVYWKNNTYDPIPWTANTVYTEGTAVSEAGDNYITTGNVYASSFDLVSDNVSVLPSLYSLGTIRRGTHGTSISSYYGPEREVIDASVLQQIPGVSFAKVRFATIQMNENITANIGDLITQTRSTATWRVVSSVSDTANVLISYEGTFNSLLGPSNVIAINGNTTTAYPISNVNTAITQTITSNPSYDLVLSGNVTANVGDIITQSTTGVNATVLGSANTGSVGTRRLLIKYNNGNQFELLIGNVVPNSNIAINNTFTSDVQAYPEGPIYPISSTYAGYLGNVNGNISVTEGTATITANTVLRTGNIRQWYDPATYNSTITDDFGFFFSSTTEAVSFLKEAPASTIIFSIIPNFIVTEDAINTITTENGNPLYKEYR